MDSEQSRQIESLYMQMYPKLLCYALASIPKSLAEEAVQETFRIACGKPGELLSSPKPAGWLMNTLRNVIGNILRADTVDRKLLSEYTTLYSRKFSCAEDREALDLLYGELAQTPEFKLLRELAVRGKTVQEIARRENISVTACYKRIERARNILRERIQK